MVNFKRFQFWGRSPLTIVEFIIAVASIIGGIYVASPLLAYSTSINGAGALVSTLGHPAALIIYGALFAISGIVMLVGIFTRRYKLRSAGLFLNICTRTYGLIGSFVVSGLFPLTWLSPLVTLLITVVCYIVVRGFIAMGGDK